MEPEPPTDNNSDDNSFDPSQHPDARPTATDESAILNTFAREGRWIVGETYRCTAVIGSGVIDLREARFTGSATTIHVRSWLGSVYVVVPDDVEVHVSGTAILGGFRPNRDLLDRSGPRRVDVTGLVVLGSVYVVDQLPQSVQRRLDRRGRWSRRSH